MNEKYSHQRDKEVFTRITVPKGAVIHTNLGDASMTLREPLTVIAETAHQGHLLCTYRIIHNGRRWYVDSKCVKDVIKVEENRRG